MTAKNDITGDFIKTKAGNNAYGEGWDRIFGNKKSGGDMERESVTRDHMGRFIDDDNTLVIYHETRLSEREKALDEMVRLNEEMGLYDESNERNNQI